MNNIKALIVVDVQNDFCPGGALAVNEGNKIIPVINSIIDKFDIIISTQDWHPANHISFASTHENKKINEHIIIGGITQALWPDHCVQGTEGADFAKDLNTKKFNLILRKGMDPNLDSYSAFLENDQKTETGLHGYLNAMSVSQLHICGLATDYCVFFSAMDSVKYGFKTILLVNASKGIDIPFGNLNKRLKQMKDNGIAIKNTNEL